VSTARPTVAVGAIVFDDAGRVLLIRRGRPPGEGLWSVPGGKVEPGERLADAVAREVREETGLEVAPGALVEVVERITTEGDATWHYVILDFLAHASPGEVRRGDDAADARWFGIDELDQADLTDGLLPVIDKARRQAGDLG
jgi:ADP-ribose pyrophosphatase YjhB (NUDIX family)